MPIDLSAPERAPEAKQWTLTGRFVLIALVLFFSVVAAVNAVMMTLAIRTFPGLDARNGYETSQAFNREIAAARAQIERGWQSDLVFVRDGGATALRLVLLDRAGAPVSGLAMEGRIKHPSDRRLDRVVTLGEPAPGTYETRIDGLATGAWGIELAGKERGERVFALTSRATLKD